MFLRTVLISSSIESENSENMFLELSNAIFVNLVYSFIELIILFLYSLNVELMLDWIVFWSSFSCFTAFLIAVLFSLIAELRFFLLSFLPEALRPFFKRSWVLRSFFKAASCCLTDLVSSLYWSDSLYKAIAKFLIVFSAVLVALLTVLSFGVVLSSSFPKLLEILVIVS